METLEERRVLAGVPIISEVLASNDSIIDDEDGDDSDFIELTNAGDDPVSLNRYYLTDDPGDLQKWRLPDVQLDVGENLVIFASNKDRNEPDGELHTNFRLSSNGEYLALVEPDGQTIAHDISPGYPQQVADVSYGVPTGILDSVLLDRDASAKLLVPTDGSLDPGEPDVIAGTWLDSGLDDSSWATVTGGIGFVASIESGVLADSVADFSGVQGQDSWSYGTWATNFDDDGIYSISDFSPIDQTFFVDGKWDAGLNGRNPNTELTADGGQPATNGFLQHWAVRRWTSETTGEITITGTLGNVDPSGDGVVGRILVNGNEIYAETVNGSSHEYNVTATVQAGDFVDFAIDAGSNEDETGDASTFTAHVVGFPLIVLPEVPVANSQEDWEPTEIQGASNNWFYGFYDASSDPDATYQDTNFQALEWTGDRWGHGSFDTSIRSTLQVPHAAEDAVQWSMRRWESTIDGTLKIEYEINKSATGGDGTTARLFHNGVELDVQTFGPEDQLKRINSFTVTGVAIGDKIDFAVDPTGTAPDNIDGERDRMSVRVRINRVADIAENIQTDINDQMFGVGSTAYVRIPFNVDDLAALDVITLNIRYDDAFVAYINGTLVAEGNAPSAPTFDSVANEKRTPEAATLLESIDISDQRGLFHEGVNLLQLHLINASADDAEAAIQSEIIIGTLTIETDEFRYFGKPSPGASNGLGANQIGPQVIDSSHSPASPTKEQSIVVTAVVNETFNAVTDVQLTYRVMYDEGITIPMTDDGSGADAVAADGIYTAEIPGNIATEGQMIRWSIVATDDQGLSGNLPTGFSKDEQYKGTIVHDPAAVSELDVFHAFIESITDAGVPGNRTTGSIYHNGEFYSNVSFSVHGQSSASFPKKGYNVDFPNDHRFLIEAGMPRVDDINLLTNFADQSKLRNTLAYEQRAFTGGAHHLAYPVHFRNNAEFFGVYDFVEDPGTQWLVRLGEDPTNRVFKMNNDFANVVTTVSAAEAKTRQEEGKDILRDLVTGVLSDESTTFIMDNVNLAQMANYLAGFVLTSNRDCCNKNYYAYRNESETGEWWFLPWDVDLSNGRNFGGFNRGYFDETIYFQNELFVARENALISRLYDDVPGFRDMYLRRVRTLMDEYVKPPGTPRAELPLEQRVDELRALMSEDADLDNAIHANDNVWQSPYQTFDQGVQELLDLYSTPRREWLYTTQTVDGGGPVPAEQIGNPTIEIGTIEFNPASRNQSEEYIVLTNNNDTSVDISDWTMTGSINHVFEPGTVLPRGTSMYMTPNAKAFRARAEGPSGGMQLFVQGNYDGTLPNVGGELKLLAKDGSLVNEVTYQGTVDSLQEDLRISEVMYNPLSASAAEIAVDNSLISEDFEFLEFVNVSNDRTLDLSEVRISNGVDFNFSDSEIKLLAPGERALVVANLNAFTLRYGAEAASRVAGTFAANSALRDSGETITVLTADASIISDFAYDDAAHRGWPILADGHGSSLQIIDPAGDYQEATNWRASVEIGGTPGVAGAVASSGIVINEVLTATANPQTDQIELYNPTASVVALTNYFLSDGSGSIDDLRRMSLASYSVPANGYLVLTEADFNPGGGQRPNDFALSRNGDELYLTFESADGSLAFADGVVFGPAATQESFGRTPNGIGRLYPNVSPTFGSLNSAPRVGPIVITEVAYSAGEPSAAALAIDPNLTSGDLEFVEVHNPTNATVDLSNWSMRLGADYIFDDGTQLASGETVVIISFNPLNPANADRLEAFRAHYRLSTDVRILGGYGGQLNRSGDGVQLRRLNSGPDGLPRLLEDEVVYDNIAPWPRVARSLARSSATAYGNDANSWSAALPTPGRFGAAIPGDLTQDGVVDLQDAERLHEAALAGDLSADLTTDGRVDTDDLVFLLEDVIGTRLGDVTGDGQFDSEDIVAIFIIGGYEDGIPGNATYLSGDWDLDGEFTASDLDFAFERGGFIAAASPASVAASDQAAALAQDPIGKDRNRDKRTADSQITSQSVARRRLLETAANDSVFAHWEPNRSNGEHESSGADVELTRSLRPFV